MSGAAKASPPKGYNDNPKWTETDFAQARPANEVVSVAAAAALVKNRSRRPRGSEKVQASLRIDPDVLERFRATRPGWQTRTNDELRRAAP